MHHLGIFSRIVLSVFLLAVFAAETKRSPFGPNQKAFYASPQAVAFIRPGVAVKVNGATIAADGTITVRLTVTDPRGVPLDRDGITTPGNIALSLIAAVYRRDTNMYFSYTTRTQTSTITGNRAIQAASDAGGTWTKTADGEYTYRFNTRAPSGFDANATHTIGVYGNRNLTEFDLGTNYFSTLYHFVPAGGTPTPVREVIKNASCNSCHRDLNAHGGSRRGLEMCILCHTPQTIDPDTGNTVDMTVMTHKIHMGKNLPSVRAGKPYQIIGFGNNVIDYSLIGYPADTRNCTSCHIQTGTQAGAQATNLFQPTREACGSCHDDVNFATGVGHIAQADDTRCSQCHRPDGQREFDASIRGAHTIPERSTNLKGQSIQILGVRNTGPGQRPIVNFIIKDSAGVVVPPDQMNSLSLVLAGPTSDYKHYWSESARLAPQGTDGSGTYTFTRAIPEDSTGTYSISAEGYRNVTFTALNDQSVTVRDPLKNVITYFDLAGGRAEPRRTVVTLAKCNACHSNLELHGRNRNQIEHCVVCHNPNVTDVARRPAGNAPAESVNFGTMIHRIHTGDEQGRPLVYYGFGGSANTFSDVAFPMPSQNCDSCHVNNSQNLPLRSNLQNVVDPRGFLTTPGPAASACLGCHTSRDAAAHAELNTSRLGESCGVCHGNSAEFSVAKVHAQ